MRWWNKGVAIAALAVAMGSPQLAQAQATDADALMALDKDSLRAEIQTRFDAALAASNDPALINGDDPRYLWALEAKAQCGIALGYLKSGTKDPVSIGKCARAHQLMQLLPPPPQPIVQAPPPQPEAPAQCANDVAGIVFFEFDSAEAPADADQTVNFVRDNYQVCGWQAFTVTGHTDRSGSDAYNQGLSEERASTVVDLMTGAGIPASMITSSAQGETNPRVPTADGVREAQNRRVEVTVR